MHRRQPNSIKSFRNSCVFDFTWHTRFRNRKTCRQPAKPCVSRAPPEEDTDLRYVHKNGGSACVAPLRLVSDFDASQWRSLAEAFLSSRYEQAAACPPVKSFSGRVALGCLFHQNYDRRCGYWYNDCCCHCYYDCFCCLQCRTFRTGTSGERHTTTRKAFFTPVACFIDCC